MKVADQVWLITGASSGFGEALAEAVLTAGGTVVATFRKPDQVEAFADKAPGRAHGILMDVTDKASVDKGVQFALDTCGRIDVLVNNAGYALRGILEVTSDEEAWHQLDTNVMGIIRVTRAALPSMRAQGSGLILNIASVAGTIGFPMMSLYAASKHAVVGLSESLAKEVGQFGINVTSVEPGAFRTKFGSTSMVTPAAPAPAGYAPLVEQMDASIRDFEHKAAGDPVLAAQKLLELATMDAPPIRMTLGDDALPWTVTALQGRIEEYEKHAALGQGTSAT